MPAVRYSRVENVGQFSHAPGRRGEALFEGNRSPLCVTDRWHLGKYRIR